MSTSHSPTINSTLPSPSSPFPPTYVTAPTSTISHLDKKYFTYLIAISPSDLSTYSQLSHLRPKSQSLPLLSTLTHPEPIHHLSYSNYTSLIFYNQLTHANHTHLLSLSKLPKHKSCRTYPASSLQTPLYRTL
ncbi:hypothetical protein M758_10G080700 [Ceratodon purpureus]|uniref:Uncharacterized protein n=1 Tax=Ceratodon purpureus TaxID=3225 RepID=A0A8T0GKP7_CERPU|nr:hypothetical protein KC19_10G082000 [Ceratodon purpureus]KAG0603268.1 hypothetical protein M758_10G080700 [Ceratodon purpureus]